MDVGLFCRVNYCVAYGYRNPASVRLVQLTALGAMSSEPHHWCSFQGLETDLVNLTACVGVELWRFSASCTVESVRATSVIFLLGVGSFACYKIYENYIRKSQDSSSKKPPSGGLSPGSKSPKFFRWLSEEELLDAEDYNDADRVKRSYFGPEDPSDDPYSSSGSGSGGEWADAEGPFVVLSASHRHRDTRFTSKRRCKRSDMGNVNSHSPTVTYRDDQVKIHTRNSRNHICRSSSSSSSTGSSKSNNREIPYRVPRGRKTNPKDTRQKGDGSDNIPDHQNNLLESLSSTHSYVGTECENSLNDEERTAVSGSLKGNFSPTSLIMRNYRADFRDRAPPDGEEPSGRDSRLGEDDVFEESYLEDISTASSIGKLIREMSVGSDASELEVISWELPLPEDLDRSGMSRFERIENELQDLKKDCLSMDADMDVYRKPPDKAYFELVKTSLSDLEDTDSTRSNSASVLTPSSSSKARAAKDMAHRLRHRAAFKGLLEEDEDRDKEDDTSTPSLEWDSMRNPKSGGNKADQFSSSCVTAVDSGSDFGTPLTNESPEFRPKNNSSSASLEWDDEHCTRKLSNDNSLACVPELGIAVLVDEEEKICGGPGNLAHDVGSKLSDWLMDKEKTAWSSQESSGFLEEGSNYFSGCSSKQMTPEDEEAWKVMKTRGNDMMDSAYCESQMLVATGHVVNVGPTVDVVKYGLREWKGDTPQASRMREGYKRIRDEVGYDSIRRIRGDNYCAVRSTLFQILSQGIEIAAPYGGIPSFRKKLRRLVKGNGFWGQWRFAGRGSSDAVREMERCLGELYEVVVALRSTTVEHELVAQLFNSVPELEISLLEAVKILMMISACELHADMADDRPVPVFAYLMFARETSDSPERFLRNHLNRVGDGAGLEQVEMFLLGYALGVVIKVVRPSRSQHEDFVCHFPDDREEWPQVCLVAEDDRHYNVLLRGSEQTVCCKN